jgi:hypothetical protein
MDFVQAKTHIANDLDRLDGFAINIGDPTGGYVNESLGYLFGYGNYVGFKMFVSMDLAASSGDVGLASHLERSQALTSKEHEAKHL